MVKSVEAVRQGDELDVSLSDGVLSGRVEATRRIDTDIVEWKDPS